MTKEGKFVIYCLEIFKREKNLTGKDVVELFSKADVFNYILSCYEALHTTGDLYIVKDLEGFISESN